MKKILLSLFHSYISMPSSSITLKLPPSTSIIPILPYKVLTYSRSVRADLKGTTYPNYLCSPFDSSKVRPTSLDFWLCLVNSGNISLMNVSEH